MKIKKDTLAIRTIIVFAYLLAIFLNIKYGQTVLDSDMASEMVLANILNEEGSILSSNWIASTELRVLSLNLTLKLGLMISPNNWRIARIISQSVLLLIYCLSTLFFLKNIGLGKKSYYIGALVLLPMGLWNTQHNLFGGFYIIHTIPVLILNGLLLKIINSDELKKIYIIIYFILSFLFALNGMKLLLYFSIPSFIAMVILTLIRNQSLDELFKTKSIKKFFICIISCVMSLCGYFVYVLLSKKYPIGHENDFVWKNFDLSKMLDSFSYYLNNFGYPDNEFFEIDNEIFTKTGIFGAFGFLIIIIVFYSLIDCVKKVKTQEENRTIIVFALSQILFVIVSLTLVYDLNGSYFLPLIPFTFVLIEITIDSLNLKIVTNKIKNTLRIAFVIILTLASITNVYYYVNEHPNRNSSINYVVEYLTNNNISSVYAKFWDGNVITELSNGKIDAYVVEDIDTLEMKYLLQDKRHFETMREVDYIVVNRKYRNYFNNENSETYKIVYDNDYLIVKILNYDDYISLAKE